MQFPEAVSSTQSALDGAERPHAANSGSPRPLVPQQAGQPCPTCGGEGADDGTAGYAHVYAIGRIEPRFPRAAVEKEFAQVRGRADTNGKADSEAFHAVLSRRENRYLVRKLCWVLSVQGLETYLLQPRDPADFDLLVEAIRPRPSPMDLDMVIGVRGPVAPPEMCNGIMLPVVGFDQIYSFDRGGLMQAIPRPEKSEEAFDAAAEEVFDLILQMTDNAGATDEHRALNYLAMRYPAIYATAAEQHARNASLTGVEVRPSALSGTHRIVEVVFSFTHRSTDVTEKFFTRVDVTEEFPFLVTKMSPYYHRS
jgi:PatG C-terminal